MVSSSTSQSRAASGLSNVFVYGSDCSMADKPAQSDVLLISIRKTLQQPQLLTLRDTPIVSIFRDTKSMPHTCPVLEKHSLPALQASVVAPRIPSTVQILRLFATSQSHSYFPCYIDDYLELQTEMNASQRPRDHLDRETYRTDGHGSNMRSEDTSRQNLVNFIPPGRDRQYIESSHPFVLARGIGTPLLDQFQRDTRPLSRKEWNSRRPCTPVPSLMTSDTMTPRSVNAISPTTPVFDAGTDTITVARPSHNRRPTPLNFDRACPKINTDPHIPAIELDCDPASTYQPRRIVAARPSTYATQQSPTSASTDETSFIEWDDDDPSRLQRMKQSLTFSRPQRSNKENQATSKHHDRYLDAIPRLPLRSKSQSTQQTRTNPLQTLPKSSTSHHLQSRSPPIRAPASFDQPRYLASHVPCHPDQLPRVRYSEEACGTPPHQHITTQTRQRPSHYTNSHTKALPNRPFDTLESRPSRYPTRQPTHPHHHLTRAKYQNHHHSVEHASGPIDDTDTVTSTSPSTLMSTAKPKRLKELMQSMQSVMKRVSTRDLRKEARQGR